MFYHVFFLSETLGRLRVAAVPKNLAVLKHWRDSTALTGTRLLLGCLIVVVANHVSPVDLPLVVAQDARESEAEDQSQSIVGDTIHDVDYAVTLTRPSTDWRFLRENEATNLHSDAILAAINPGQSGFLMLIAERLNASSLNEYADIVVGSLRDADQTVGAVSDSTIEGHPAKSFEMEARVNGLQFRYLYTITENKGFFYQIIGWSLDSSFESVAEDLSDLQQSIRFDPDRQPRPRALTRAQDEQDINWILKDGVFRNVAYGFQLSAVSPFRLAGRQDLQTMGDDSAAGLVASNPTFYQVYIVELVGDQDHERFASNMLDNVEQELVLAGTGFDETDVVVGGIAAKQRVYTNTDLVGEVKFDVVQTWFYREDVLYRIQSWWPSSEAEDARLLLEKSYQTLSWMTDVDVAEAIAQQKNFDFNNRVGDDFAMRNGVYHDFKFGFELAVPVGTWEIKTGPAAQQMNQVARLVASSASEGIFFIVIPEELDMPHRPYHDLILQNMDVPESTTVDPVRIEDTNLFVSAFDKQLGQIPMHYKLVTAVNGTRHVQVLAWVLKPNQKKLDNRFDEIFQGIKIPDMEPTMIVQSKEELTDHRLGFRITHGSGWDIQNNAMPNLSGAGNMVVLSSGDVAIVMMAICAPDGFDEDLAIEAMMKNGQMNVDSTTRQEQQSSLANLPARQISFVGTRDDIEMKMTLWLAHRGNTVVLFLVNQQMGNPLRPESFTKYLTLIE